MAKKEGKGKLLTTFILFWIIIYTLGFLFISIIDFPPGMNKLINDLLFKNQPSWFKYCILLFALLDIVALFGMWMLRKWGTYLYFGSTLIGIVVSLVTTGLVGAFIQSTLYSLIIALTAYIIIRRKWHLFS